MIIALFIILTLLLLFTAKEQGLKIIFTICFHLIFILICIVFIAYGAPVFLVSVVIAILFIAFTMFYQYGLHEKTILLVFSCLLTLLFIYAIVYVFVSKIQISGLNELDLSLDVSQAIDVSIPLSMDKISIAVVLLSMLGVIMDACVAVSFSMFEFYESHEEMSFHTLYQFAHTIGYDILGTTINTLLIAAMGDFYLYGIFFAINHVSLLVILNSKAVYQSFASVFLGSIATLLILPITVGLNLLYLRRSTRQR